MATVTKTYRDNDYYSSTYRKTWTANYISAIDNIEATGGTFDVTAPNITLKFTGSSGVYRRTEINSELCVDEVPSPTDVNWLWLDPITEDYKKGASGTLFNATLRVLGEEEGYEEIGGDTATVTLNTADFFNASNASQRIRALAIMPDPYLQTDTKSAGGGYYSEYYDPIQYNDDTESWGYWEYDDNDDEVWVEVNFSDYAIPLYTLTLNALPSFNNTPISFDKHYIYSGLTTASITISNASAQFGGSIVSSAFTIGNQTVTGNGNGTLSIALDSEGVFTPTVSVTDSRGQTKTVTLPPITVLGYRKPQASVTALRTTASGSPLDEGESAVITATFNYAEPITTLLEPLVKVDGNIRATTWYESWSNGTLSSPVNWTDYNPQSPVTLYGLVSGTLNNSLSYTIGVVPRDATPSGSGTEVTTILPTAYYTIDFQAGGKEIAFGAPANDDITDFNGNDYSDTGLFKCSMAGVFNDMTAQEIADFVDSLTQPTPVLADYEVESYLVDTITNTSAHGEQSYNISKPGYYPVSVVGWQCAGSLSSYLNLYQLRLSAQSVGSGTIGYSCRVTGYSGSTTPSVTITVSVLWRKAI